MLFRAFASSFGNCAAESGDIPVGLTRDHDVKQQRRHTGIGKVRRDPRSHSPGAQDGHTTK